jgi:hypothetical protein
MNTAAKAAPRQLPKSGTPIKLVRVIAVLLMLTVGVSILVLAMNNDEAGNRDYWGYWAAGHQLIHHQNPYDSKAIVRMVDPTGKRKSMVLRNPPYALFITLPLGLLSLKTGAVLWSLALIGALMGSIRVLRTMEVNPPEQLHLIGYVFGPALACLLAGQIGIFLLVGVTIFLRFHRSRPYLAGAALLICALKPHLFLPFLIALVGWIVVEKAYRVLAGAVIAVVASTVLTCVLDPGIWSQYVSAERGEKIQNLFIPCLSVLFRIATNRNVFWLQFLPELAGCGWAVWYFKRNRHHWHWKEHAPVLLLVSVLVAPYAWFTDESLLLPAIMAGLYRACNSRASINVFAVLAGIALLEVVAGVPLASVYYLWTAPAWLVWYLIASSRSAPDHTTCTDRCPGEAQLQEI